MTVTAPSEERRSSTNTGAARPRLQSYVPRFRGAACSAGRTAQQGGLPGTADQAGGSGLDAGQEQPGRGEAGIALQAHQHGRAALHPVHRVRVLQQTSDRKSNCPISSWSAQSAAQTKQESRPQVKTDEVVSQNPVS